MRNRALSVLIALAVVATPLTHAQRNTSNVGNGNQGNGLGNTGPGNQGNTSPVGNAGGSVSAPSNPTNPSNSNSNVGNGNQGNGVGNTGPGNQGNTKPNGNAGGAPTGGSSTGGSSTGGSSTGGSSTGGSSTGGSSTGGSSTGGSSTGGSSTGGSSTGGSSTGGSSTGGGSTDGGSTGGGSTDGGSTGGGSTGGGSTGGGSTDGSSTGGGSTDGGSTGGSTGGETSEGTPGEDTKTDPDPETEQPVETKKKESKTKLKARVLPLVFGHYNIQNKIINLTPFEGEVTASSLLVLDNYRDGFRLTQLRSYIVGMGVAPQVYLSGATGLASLATGIVGIAPVIGKTVVFERFAGNEDELNSMKRVPLPFRANHLNEYKTGESVYFESVGGLLYTGGLGLAAAYVGGSVVAEGGVRTLVTKTDDNKAYVQINKINLRKLSMFTGVAVLALDATRERELTEGLAFNFNFKAGNDVVSAYENLLAGNAIPAQELAKKGIFSGVEKVQSSQATQVSKKRGITLGVPMIALANWTTGKTYGKSETQLYADNSQTTLNYGIYFKENNGRFFHKHKKLVRSFYSGQAVNVKEGKVQASEQKATFYWSYENDSASSKHFAKALKTLQKDFGVAESFNPSLNLGQKLGYIKLEAQVDFPEDYTKKLIRQASDQRFTGVMVNKGLDLVSNYFAKGDLDELCTNDDDEETPFNSCRMSLEYHTQKSLGRISSILVSMKNVEDGAELTELHAQIGKELIRNQFIMGAIFSQDTNCQISYKVKIEGQRLSQVNTKIPANPACR